MKWILMAAFLSCAHWNASAFPAGKLFDSQGQSVTASTSKKKELVVFWATWCPDCKEKLSKVFPSRLADPDVEIVLVNTEKDTQRAVDFLKKEGLPYKTYFDTERSLRKDLAIFGVPGWAVYTRDATGQPVLVDHGSPFDNDRVNAALGKKFL